MNNIILFVFITFAVIGCKIFFHNPIKENKHMFITCILTHYLYMLYYFCMPYLALLCDIMYAVFNVLIKVSVTKFSVIPKICWVLKKLGTDLYTKNSAIISAQSYTFVQYSAHFFSSIYQSFFSKTAIWKKNHGHLEN